MSSPELFISALTGREGAGATGCANAPKGKGAGKEEPGEGGDGLKRGMKRQTAADEIHNSDPMRPLYLVQNILVAICRQFFSDFFFSVIFFPTILSISLSLSVFLFHFIL